MKKACAYLSTGNYEMLSDDVHMYVGSFDLEQDVQPFMLSYRNYILYFVDVAGLSDERKHNILERMPNLIRSYSTRVFVLWSSETRDAMLRLDPRCMTLPNCVYGDQPNWVDDIKTALRHVERKLKDANRKREE